MLITNSQYVQAKGQNGKVGAKQESVLKGNKHPNARANKGDSNTTSVGSSKRLEGKEKAIERRLEGKEKAIERRLEGKQKAIEKRSENAAQKGHKGRGKHKRNSQNLNNQGHTNRGDLTSSNESLKQEKNKRYIKQNGVKERPQRIQK